MSERRDNVARRVLTPLVKQFKKWIDLKENIHSNHTTPLFRAGEMWWCAVGANVGAEIDGKNNLFERPVYVLRKCGPEMFLGLPLTSKQSDPRPYYCHFRFHDQQHIAILSQARVMSGQRLVRRIGKVSGRQEGNLLSAFVRYIMETGPLRGPRVPNGRE